MYTVDDVQLAWTTSKHLKQRDINSIAPIHLFAEALSNQKKVVALVYNVVKYVRELRRVEFNLACGRLYKFDEFVADERAVQNYWKIQVTPDFEHAYRFRPAEEFSKIVVVQPLGEYEGTNLAKAEAWRDPARVRREPRLNLKPKYGPDYVHNLQDSIPFRDLLEWTQLVHVVYQSISAQFFKDGRLE
jgi:hypothetical protein